MTSRLEFSPKTRRRTPNGSEKLAAALLKIQVGVGNWLIPEPLRSMGTAKEICAAVDFDHARRHAEGGTLAPQNLFPMMRADHRAKTEGKRGDIAEVAKGKRYGKKEAKHRARLAAKKNTLVWDSNTANWAEPEGEALEELQRLRGETKQSQRPKAKIKSAGFRGHRKFDGTPVYAKER